MNLFTQSGSAPLIVLLMLMPVIAWVLFRTYRGLARHRINAASSQPSRPQPDDSVHHLDLPPEGHRWEVQMHETARDLSARLDSKMGALQALIADADRAAARLEAASDGRSQPAREDAEPITQAEALLSSGDSHDDGASPRQAEVCALADYGFDAAEIADRIGRPVGEVELILSLRHNQ